MDWFITTVIGGCYKELNRNSEILILELKAWSGIRALFSSVIFTCYFTASLFERCYRIFKSPRCLVPELFCSLNVKENAAAN